MSSTSTITHTKSESSACPIIGVRQVTLPGPEDITIDPELCCAFISSDDRTWRGRGSTGGLWRLDLRDPQANPVRLPEAPADFHPCGLSLLRTGDNTRLMFVVNRRAIADPTVEIFAVSEEALRHEETIRGGDALTSPNDIAATGPASFYVTNDHGFKSAFSQRLEELRGQPRGNVVYYDGHDGRFTTVVGGLAYANGIAVDVERHTLYVAVAGDNTVLAYPWDQASPATPLADPEPIRLDGGPDNLEWDPTGNLLVAVHPNRLAILMHIATRGWWRAPSRILRILLPERSLETLYDDESGQIAGASVGALFESQQRRCLLIGSAFDDHLEIVELSR